MRERLF